MARNGSNRMARQVKYLPYHLRHKAKGTPSRGKGRATNGLMLRGVVLETYFPDDPVGAARAAVRGFIPGSESGVLCDVLITDSEYRTLLKDVPIMVASGGLNDHEVWVPRKTTIDITPGILTTSLEGLLIPPTPTHKMDGDHVVVAFMGDDLNQPFIIGQLPHPSSKRRPSFLDEVDPLFNGPFKWRRFIRGIDFGVNDSGNIFVDMSNASNGLTAPTGDEIPLPGLDPLGGNMTITLFTGVLNAAAKISIIDSVLTAPEPVILGDTWLTDASAHVGDFDGHLLDLNTFLTSLSLALTEMLGIAAFGLPVVNITAAIAQVATFQAAIAATQALNVAYQAQIAVAQGVGLPYLSSHLEVD